MYKNRYNNWSTVYLHCPNYSFDKVLYLDIIICRKGSVFLKMSDKYHTPLQGQSNDDHYYNRTDIMSTLQHYSSHNGKLYCNAPPGIIRVLTVS